MAHHFTNVLLERSSTFIVRHDVADEAWRADMLMNAPFRISRLALRRYMNGVLPRSGRKLSGRTAALAISQVLLQTMHRASAGQPGFWKPSPCMLRELTRRGQSRWPVPARGADLKARAGICAEAEINKLRMLTRTLKSTSDLRAAPVPGMLQYECSRHL